MIYFFYHTFAYVALPHFRTALLADKAGIGLPAYTRVASLALRRPSVLTAETGAISFGTPTTLKKGTHKKIKKYTQNQCVDSNLSVCDVKRILLNPGKTDAKASRAGGCAMPMMREGAAM